MPDKLKVSVIILNHNTPKLIKYLLKNIKKLNWQFSHEFIFIDNGKEKDLKKELKQELRHADGKIKILESENNGYAAGNNLGIRHANGEYILILNPDLFLYPNTLENLIEFMDNNKKVGVCAPKLLYPNNDYQHSCLKFPDWRLPFYRRSSLGDTTKGKQWLNDYLLLDYNHEQPRQVDWLFGAFLFIRKKAINEVGLLDERFFMYFEDLDWCRRFWNKGWQVWYYPKSKAIHFHHRDSADRSGIKGLFTKLGRVHLSSWFKYMWKWK